LWPGVGLFSEPIACLQCGKFHGMHSRDQVQQFALKPWLLWICAGRFEDQINGRIELVLGSFQESLLIEVFAFFKP